MAASWDAILQVMWFEEANMGLFALLLTAFNLKEQFPSVIPTDGLQLT